MDYVPDFLAWRAASLADNAFSVAPIRFSQSREWHVEAGQVRRHDGGFFALGGIRAEARLPELDGLEQPIIFQPQIALNAFLARRTPAGAEVLFHGRVEPGNVGGMQLAPTIQSTASNYRRIHGGRATPFLEWFLDAPPAAMATDSLQSEEATRYHGKYNRNVVRFLRPGEDVDVPSDYRWYGTSAIRQFARLGNVINTDARSVLACLDWAHLADESGPFARTGDDVARALRRSWVATDADAETPTLEVLAWLAQLRAFAGLRTRPIALHELGNWEVRDDGVYEREPRLGFAVRQYRITARKREVAEWDQPLVDSASAGRVTLLCQERGGMARLLVRASCEVGFLEGVQLGASIMVVPGQREPGDAAEARLAALVDDGERCRLRHRIRQSEEGGRFFQDENVYEVAFLDPGVELAPSDRYRWLTLRQVRQLIEMPGVFSIELRDALTLLLADL